jgi:hypothetical protein
MVRHRGRGWIGLVINSGIHGKYFYFKIMKVLFCVVST